MRFKRSKFRMDIYIGDGMLQLSIYISEREFKDFLVDLQEQHSKHDDTNQEFYTEYRTKVIRDCESEVVTMHVFGHGESEIYLYEFRAKDGYGYKQ